MVKGLPPVHCLYSTLVFCTLLTMGKSFLQCVWKAAMVAASPPHCSPLALFTRHLSGRETKEQRRRSRRHLLSTYEGDSRRYFAESALKEGTSRGQREETEAGRELMLMNE